MSTWDFDLPERTVLVAGAISKAPYEVETLPTKMRAHYMQHPNGLVRVTKVERRLEAEGHVFYQPDQLDYTTLEVLSATIRQALDEAQLLEEDEDVIDEETRLPWVRCEACDE